ncbi:MAG: hypothetical protein FVQ81_08020 [Candidatus Glassbacteria bacterium]|nr:hypothetical protein [Candidatus Glassbacteria bacterium]
MGRTMILLVISAMVTQSPILRAESRWERLAAEHRAQAREIIRFSHEPIQFNIRKGKLSEDWLSTYEKQHTRKQIALKAKLGGRYERLHFYKGYGLEFEMPEIRKSVSTAALMHEYGMKVSLYVGGSMFIETFFRETPEAAGWAAVDQDGGPIFYIVNDQTFRQMPCPNEQGYRDYIKRVLDVGLDSVKTDQFFFDNYFQRAEPNSCRCERCMAGFQEWLRQKYPTPDSAYKRFGYRDLGLIRVNEWDDFNRPDLIDDVIYDPVVQDWVRFRCESLADQCREFYDHIKSRNPQVTAGFNLKGLYSLNRIWYNAIHHGLFAGSCDFFCFDIAGADPGLAPATGALISEIRSYKIARRLDMACSNGDPGIELAEQMAFNNQKYVEGFGYLGAAYNHYAQRIFSPQAEFFRHYNDRYYTDTDNVTDVAVLRSWPSMAYSIGDVWTETTLAEQVLIQHRVPFDIIFDEQMDELDRYRLLLLAGQRALSGENAARLERFVRGGGTLVFTAQTADFNEWWWRKAANPLLGLMGLDSHPTVQTRRRLGEGVIVYLPEIVPAGEITPNGRWQLPADQWLLPANHWELFHAVASNLPGGLSLEAEAPLTTCAEILKRERTRETIVHFVNYDPATNLAPFRARVKPQFGRRVKKVEYLSPALSEPLELKYELVDGMLEFTLPETGMYAMVVISQ